MPTSGYPTPGEAIGRFRIIAQLGAGGMGVVYEALEENLGRQVALKVISPQFAQDPDFRRRFTSEARALASLDSPHVVQVYAHGEEDGFLYIATQLVPDGDLGTMLRTWGAAPVGKAVDLLEQVASGLADAHAAGLVHRDIKPANVLVRRRGSSVYGYLGDFGIARRVDAEVTRVGQAAIGTPSYMAPELHAGAPAGVASDVYSLGCLLWVTLTGSAPYVGTSEYEIVSGHVSKPVPQLAGDGALVRETNRILNLAMAKDPARRYPTAAALRDDLRRAASLTTDASYATMGVPSGLSETRVPGASWTPGATPVPTPTPTPVPGPVSVPVPVPAPQHSAASPGRSPLGPPAPYSGGPAPYGPSPRRSRTLLWLGLGVAGVIVVAGAVVAGIAVSGGSSDGGGGGATSDPGFADGSAQDIIDAAQHDMQYPASVHLDGEVAQGEQDTKVDMIVTTSGDCDGTISIGAGTAAVRSIDGSTWFKPDAAFWKQQAGSAELAQLIIGTVGDDWVVVGGDNATEFDQICDLDKLIADDGEQTTLAKAGTGEIDGRPVVRISSTEASGTSTISVATDSPHYVLEVDGPSGDGTFTFSDFDEPFTATAPPADQVTDFPTDN